jgi:hypothetical protein
VNSKLCALNRILNPISAKVETAYVVRWICVIPAAWAAFYIALLISMVCFQTLNGLCPGSEVHSGLCGNGWVVPATFVIGAAIAPALVILAGTLTAPSHRPYVAWALYVTGALFASRFARLPSAFLTAGISGATTAGILHWKYRNWADRRITNG